MKSDLNPAALYLPRVFLWFPHLLIDKVLECPKCKEKALECSECKKKGSECSKHAKQSELGQKGYTQPPYARRVVDLNGLTYARRYLQYLQAVFIRQQQQPTLRQHLFKEESFFFSTLDDGSKYAGHVPSTQYLCPFYTAYIAALQSFMDKQMEILDGKYLKGDHTFKIIKCMSKVNGVPVFAALYANDDTEADLVHGKWGFIQSCFDDSEFRV
ncbi:hypothetical protein INT45_001760 [Circinella minor]|uniref:Uncharacterized protein n=1 Tax=Circinella minor TaxID=1195481 RepID=A0A8H7VIC7_9FUNG|nr:hypothetical protein INT45_001760 [Circinella minor]